MSDISTQGPAQLKSNSANTQEPDPEALQPSGTEDVKVTAADSGVAPATRMAPDPLLLTLTLDAGTTLVNQVRRTVFDHPGDESLYAMVESSLVDITWVLVFTRHNFTASGITVTVSTKTQRKVTRGTETNHSLNIGAAYNGLSISYGFSHKTFSTAETVGEREVKTVYTIPPQSSLYVYQKHYCFKENIWWIADAWNDLWNVGRPGGGYELAIATFNSDILADEQVATDKPLTGTQRVQVPPFRPQTVPWNHVVRQFDNHTPRTCAAVRKTLNDANTGS